MGAPGRHEIRARGGRSSRARPRADVRCQGKAGGRFARRWCRPAHRRYRNAKARIAAAVYGPMPGNARSALGSDGRTPPCCSTTATARRVQAHGARVVSESLPNAQDRARRAARERREVGKARDERLELWHDAVDLRLCEHELADDGAVGTARAPPGQRRASLTAVPAQQTALQRRHERSAEIASPIRRMPSAISWRVTAVNARRM